MHRKAHAFFFCAHPFAVVHMFSFPIGYTNGRRRIGRVRAAHGARSRATVMLVLKHSLLI
jgi:hypothetical protein